jgi:hypothetical protein
VSNGFERDGMNVDILRQIEALKRNQNLSPIEQLRLRKMFPRLATPNLAFRNLHNLKFEDKSAEWHFNEPVISHGMALADLDNDGDLDIAVNNFNDGAMLYRNETTAPRIAVRLKGIGNTRGIGAKIKVFGGVSSDAAVVQSQEMICGGRYMSSDDAIRTFAAGPGEMTIEVTWRSGRKTTINGARANRLYEVAESAATQTPQPKIQNPPGTPLFTDATAVLGHKHVEEPFDDFARQPLLPYRLSQLGPGVAWVDLNSDGWEDLVIGSGKGGTLAAFVNNRKGGFERSSEPPFNQPVTRDQTTVLAWRNRERPIVLVGSANYEDGLAAGGAARVYDLNSRTLQDAVAAQASSTGPLAMADIDNGGDLDLFVGGRVIAGNYPQPASSMLFRWSGSSWTPDAENNRRLDKVGLVSGAVFSDFDGDGDPDLILACQWGPIRVFRNTGGRFEDVTKELKLDQFTGWWNGVTTGDFDNDGRLDIVASNWGRNTRYESFRGNSWSLFYGDIDGNGAVEAIESYRDARSRQLPLQPFHLVGAALPLLRERVGTFDAYAKATLPEIYGQEFHTLKELKISAPDSMVFLNRGSHFEPKPLPTEAQLSPAFAICVADFDGDGNEDIFLGQNFFATHPETSRYDAGRGLLLKGNGHGEFRALSGQESGILVYGEQRGAAVCDYDRDGRADLVVTQNGAETRLFRNTGGKPCLRVRLQGPAGNPDGVGATIRIGTASRLGPAREVHAGSGYWSQDSAVQVMAFDETPTQVVVRWPDGKITTSEIPANAKEAVVNAAGQIRAGQ